MMEDMNDIEKITWIELRFGITKTIGSNPSNDKIESVENELMAILSGCREKLKLQTPVPRVRIWLTNDKLNFQFFDKKTDKRVLLGDWLSNKEKYYER